MWIVTGRIARDDDYDFDDDDDDYDYDIVTH